MADGLAYYGVVLMSTDLLQRDDVCYGLSAFHSIIAAKLQKCFRHFSGFEPAFVSRVFCVIGRRPVRKYGINRVGIMTDVPDIWLRNIFHYFCPENAKFPVPTM